MDIIMDGDFYGGGGNSSDYGEKSSDINVPRMTLKQYDTLDIKPELWIRTDEPTKGYNTSTSTLNQVYYSKPTFDLSDNVQDSFNEMQKELDTLKENMNRKLNITMLHGCRNCGAKMDIDINKPIFHCKYCDTTYVIGTVQQNSTY